VKRTPAPSERPSVLAVDDEPELLQIYLETLESEGYRVWTAADCGHAADLLRDRAFDVVISDIYLPDGTGLDLLRLVRRHDLDLPVILVTGSPTVETAIEGIELGAFRYLTKPVRSTDLLPIVRQAVRLRTLAALHREAQSRLGIGMSTPGDRAGLEAVFSRAMAGLFMVYQPIVRADDGEVFGHEALLRTREAAIIDPGAFLRAADRLHQLPELGRKVRETVIGSGPAATETLFVNLHPRDLVDDELFDVRRPLSGMASRVVLEVTEREALDPIPDLRERAHSLRQLGFRLAVDDLGAGYAGLTSFVVLEPEVVKIDMSLVRGVEREPLKRRLVGSIVELCKDLGSLVVAEGIESRAEREVLEQLGCDLLQGYELSRPQARAD